MLTLTTDMNSKHIVVSNRTHESHLINISMSFGIETRIAE